MNENPNTFPLDFPNKQQFKQTAKWMKFAFWAMMYCGIFIIILVVGTVCWEFEHILRRIKPIIGFSLLIVNGLSAVWVAWKLRRAQSAYLIYQKNKNPESLDEWWIRQHEVWLSFFAIVAAIAAFILFIILA